MAGNTPQRIAVVDDHELMRDGLVACVAKWPRGRVVLQAMDGVDYEEQCARQAPIDIAIVDLSMPRRDGFETTAWIKDNQPGTKVLVYTFDATDENVHHALRAGADGVVSKTSIGREVVIALEQLHTLGGYANDLLMRQLQYKPDPGSPMALRQKVEKTLSKQMLRFMKIYTGDDEPSIAATSERMHISEHTGESYRKDIVERTGAHTRTAMVKLMARFGFQ